MTFERTWQRPPEAEEVQSLIREHVREEVAYREAMKLGLDRDDSVVRRRLRQKLEFISENLASAAQPTDDQLRAYFAANLARYTAPPRFSFRHVYLSPERRGDRLEPAAKDVLAEIRQSRGSTADLGDPFLLGTEFDDIPGDEIGAMFGESFAGTLASLPAGEWHGPIESGYGVHLVRIDARIAERDPGFDDVKEAVERDWTSARRQEASEEFYRALLGRYDVVVEDSSFAGADPGRPR